MVLQALEEVGRMLQSLSPKAARGHAGRGLRHDR
jgi:hypothetical protein